MTTMRVIFVCVENSNRSQVAEAFARLHEAGKVEAFSAGFRPSGRINPKAVEAMGEVAYDMTRHRPKGLEGFNGREFDAAVRMGCGDECPFAATGQEQQGEVVVYKRILAETARKASGGGEGRDWAIRIAAGGVVGSRQEQDYLGKSALTARCQWTRRRKSGGPQFCAFTMKEGAGGGC